MVLNGERRVSSYHGPWSTWMTGTISRRSAARVCPELIVGGCQRMRQKRRSYDQAEVEADDGAPDAREYVRALSRRVHGERRTRPGRGQGAGAGRLRRDA